MQIRKLLLISTLINIIFVFSGAAFIYHKGGIGYLESKLYNNNKNSHLAFSDYHNDKVNIFKALPASSSDIVFLGDSITDFAEWSELFPMKSTKNRGIGGDPTSGVIDQLARITESKPAKIFLMIGINNIQGGIQEATTTKEYSEIIDQLSKSGSTIFLERILPINAKKYAEFVIPNNLGIHVPERQEIDRINAFIKRQSQNYPNIKYLDLVELLDKNGELNTDFTDDGLHLNGEGLKNLAKLLSPYVIGSSK